MSGFAKVALGLVLCAVMIGAACFFATSGTGTYVYEVSTAEPDTTPAPETPEPEGSTLTGDTIAEPDSSDESLEDDFDLLDDPDME